MGSFISMLFRLFYSALFLRKESTIVMAFRQCFFKFLLRPPELTKIVLPKVLQHFEKTPKCTCWPKELKIPPFRFFRHCATFFKKNPPKGPLQAFWSFATEWMFKNPKGSSLSVFLALRLFFQIFL